LSVLEKKAKKGAINRATEREKMDEKKEKKLKKPTHRAVGRLLDAVPDRQPPDQVVGDAARGVGLEGREELGRGGDAVVLVEELWRGREGKKEKEKAVGFFFFVSWSLRPNPIQKLTSFLIAIVVSGCSLISRARAQAASK